MTDLKVPCRKGFSQGKQKSAAKSVYMLYLMSHFTKKNISGNVRKMGHTPQVFMHVCVRVYVLLERRRI